MYFVVLEAKNIPTHSLVCTHVRAEIYTYKSRDDTRHEHYNRLRRNNGHKRSNRYGHGMNGCVLRSLKRLKKSTRVDSFD